MADERREKQRRRLQQLKNKVKGRMHPAPSRSVPDLDIPDSVKMPPKKKKKKRPKPKPSRIRRQRGDEEDTHYA